MAHIGIISPNLPGHINPMTALADALRSRGHRVTFFLLGDPLPSIGRAGFETIEIGGAVFPADDYRAETQKLGALSGRGARKHTVMLGLRATDAVLEVGISAIRRSGVTALVVDQASFAGGSVADRLDLPYATICNALMLNAESRVPPYFTSWQPHQARWGRVRNRIAWMALDLLTAPIMKRIRKFRSKHGLTLQTKLCETWSTLVQVSQEPEVFEFPRSDLPQSFHFVGPLRLPNGHSSIPFPFDRLDGRPLVYASLGTLQNRIASKFRIIAAACTGLEVQLVISTGYGISPDVLGQLPGDPIVVAYAPQLQLMRRATLAITHAGLNTVLEALSEAVPLVAVPVTNEQPGIGARVASSGSGVMLQLKRMNAHPLRAAVKRVLSDQKYRKSAQRMQKAIHDSGGAPRAAVLIEKSLSLVC